jgi:dethiobiotin synthase
VKNSATHFFITSTGTDVGKTIVSAYFCSLLPSFNYWKAVQCGPGAFQQQSYAGDAAIVEYISQSQVSTGIYLETPASPHFAAELANQTITLADIIAQQPQHKNLIIEGAGGVAVPLNGKEDIVDLVPIVKAAVILVVRPDLGTISHTRTALDFLSAKNIIKYEYDLLFIFVILSAICLCFSNEFLLIYLAIELQSLTLYIFATFNRNSEFSTEAGLKYFVFGGLMSCFLLLGMSLIYLYFGSISFELISSIINFSNEPLLFSGFLFVLIVLLFKVGSAPFHF